VGRAELEKAPRKAPRAAKTDEQLEQPDADGSPRMDAAARGAAAAKNIEAAGIVMMHGAVAQHTFTAHRRAHDAGMGAVVKRARPNSCVEQSQHQPRHTGDGTVAAFVAACCSNAAAKLLQHKTRITQDLSDGADQSVNRGVAAADAYEELPILAQPVQYQRAEAAAGEDSVASCSDAAIAFAPVASATAQRELESGVATARAQQAAARVQRVASESAGVEQSCEDGEEAQAVRSALAMCDSPVESAPAWTIDTAGERGEEEASERRLASEPTAQRAEESDGQSDAEAEELAFGIASTIAPRSVACMASERTDVAAAACSERAAAACGERAIAACDEPEMAEEPDELVFEPVSVDGPAACDEPEMAEEPDELVFEPVSVDGPVQFELVFEQIETRDAPAPSQLSASLDSIDRHAQRTGSTAPSLELTLEADSEQDASKRAASERDERRAAVEQRHRERANSKYAASADGGVDADFSGVDTQAGVKKSALVKEVERMMPPEWKADVCKPSENAASRALAQGRRTASAKRQLRQLSVGQLSNARRALEWHCRFCSAEDIPLYPVPADVLLSALEDYDLEAQERALERVEQGGSEGQLGKTAVSALRLGYLVFETHLGLDIAASDKMVKEMAKAGCGAPPKVARMTPLDGLEAFEYESRAHASEFVRAYSGAAYLGIAGSTRVIDQQRTASVHFEQHMFGGERIAVVCGTASRSKGASQAKMKALAWRAPVVNMQQSAGVNLAAMLEAMPRSADGCMYRDFEVPPGKQKIITNAIAWSNKPASHDVIVKSKQAILAPHIGEQRASRVGGHDQRHTVPEVARGLGLARSEREAIGYWRSKVVVADDERDKAALARAVAAARQVQTRSGALSYNSDRYSSVDGARVESDTARITCLKMIAQVLREQAGSLPESSKDQVNLCRNAVG
jgi:hypothetical protein